MKISVNKLQHLLSKYPEEITCTYSNDVVASGKKFKAGTQLILYDITLLTKAGYEEVEIQYNVTLYEYLSREFPIEYRKPVRWLDYYEIDHYLEELDNVNRQSKRKRFLYIVGDIFGTDLKTRKTSIILRHNEKLDFQKWKSIKIYIDSDEKFFCRNSENGIILLVNLKQDTGTDFRDKFSKHTDLVTAMISRRKDKTTEISADFIPTEDVISVTDPDKLFDEYIATNARLIIIGETLTSAHKNALIKVRDYDPFLRMMAVPAIDQTNIEHFLLQVKMVYNTDRWKK